MDKLNNENLIYKVKDIASGNPQAIKTIIAIFLIANLDNLDKVSIIDVAENCNCAKSSIVKFCKDLGCSGFKELTRILLWENTIYQTINKQKNTQQSKNEYFFEHTEKNILNLKDNYLATFIKVAQLLRKNPHIYLFGKGPNTHILEIFGNYLMKLGLTCFMSTDFDVQKHFAQNVKTNDMCFFFSVSGLTPPILEILDVIKPKKPIIITSTANLDSRLLKESDYYFGILHNEEIFADQRSAVTTFSFIVMQLLYFLELNVN